MLGSLKLVLLLSVISVCRAAEEDVLDLTDEDFSSTLADMDTALVMFYAPWCGHCKRLKPEYASAATVLKASDPPVYLAKVDCTEGGKSTCEQFSVSGYPTLKIFRNGKVHSDYNGPRESSLTDTKVCILCCEDDETPLHVLCDCPALAQVRSRILGGPLLQPEDFKDIPLKKTLQLLEIADGIVKYMRAQVGPVSKELNTVDDYKAFLNKDEVVVIGFFEKQTDLKENFMKVADTMREQIPFGHTSAPEVLAHAGYNDNIVLFRPKEMKNIFEESSVAYDNQPTIKGFIKQHYHGLVGVRTKDNMPDFKSPLVVAYYDVDYVKNPKGTNYWRNRMLKVAKDFPAIIFAISDKDDFVHELNDYGIDFAKGDKPVVAGKDADGNKFVMKDDFGVDSLHKFANDLQSGNLEPFIKSEPIPEDNSGPAKVAVGKNFKELVTDSGRDALIEFYAPWCGHCQKLAPLWEELGDKLKNEEVDVIKMDATANDWPKATYEVSGFPTIYWKSKNNEKPVKYNGGRTVEDFLKYVAEHATDELKGWDRKGNTKKEEL